MCVSHRRIYKRFVSNTADYIVRNAAIAPYELAQPASAAHCRARSVAVVLRGGGLPLTRPHHRHHHGRHRQHAVGPPRHTVAENSRARRRPTHSPCPTAGRPGRRPVSPRSSSNGPAPHRFSATPRRSYTAPPPRPVAVTGPPCERES